MVKTLYGNVTYNEQELEWNAEPGACDACKKLDGKIYKSAADIPDKPHPNCKCWIKIAKKDKKITDPIELHRKKIKDRKETELELDKLSGDANSIEEDIDMYLTIINGREKQIQQLEEAVNINKLKQSERQKILHAKNEIKSAKSATLKAKLNISNIKKEIKECRDPKKLYLKFRIIKDKLKQIQEDFIVDKAEKWNTLLYGKIHAAVFNMPESYNFFSIGIDENKNLEYINRNGKLYNSTQNLENARLSGEITQRIAKESTRTDCEVVTFGTGSPAAKKIQNSAALKKFLSENMETLKKNKSIPDTTIEFTALDKDLYSSFHGAEIKNIFVDSEENLNFRIEDYYNFNPNRTSLKGRIGEKLQNSGQLKPYYIITVLKLPKKIWQSGH